jgi:hypothetical protein
MEKERVSAALDALLETLASVEHERWSHWQSYLHSMCVPVGNTGDLLIPSNLVKRWEAQIRTPYSELSESEKESDREQVRKYLPLIIQVLSGRQRG